ncbi:MAG: hypothetical protein E6Q97_20980 [Desulfurellales bacterium]|nr:MAG: hypothetical protein E6Q97_20980 [Desulfurellales bacterium]
MVLAKLKDPAKLLKAAPKIGGGWLDDVLDGAASVLNEYVAQPTIDNVNTAASIIDPLTTQIPYLKDINREFITQMPVVGPAVSTASGLSEIGRRLGIGTPDATSVRNLAADTLLPSTPLDIGLTLAPEAKPLAREGMARAAGSSIIDNLLGESRILAGPRANAGLARGAGYDPTQIARDVIKFGPEAGLTGPLPRPVAAPDAAPLRRPAKTAKEGFAGNIRLEKFPEETRPVIQQWATENAAEAEAARRGVIPDAEVQQKARELVENTGGNWAKVQASWQPGKAFNAEEIVALNGTLASKSEEVLKAAQAVQTDDSAMAQANLVRALTEQAEIQRVVTGAKAEAGRALRANRLMVQSLGSNAQADAIRQALDSAGMDYNKISEVAKAITSGELDTPAKLNNFIRNVDKPGFWDKLHWYWMNSILSGPITQARNIVSNAATTAYSPVQRLGAAAVEQPIAFVQRRPAQRYWQEAPASVAGILQGVPEGAKAAVTMLKTGVSPRAAMKLDQAARPAPIGGLAGKIIGVPTTMLSVADEFFSAINYRSVLNAEAVRAAKMEGLKGSALSDRITELVANPPDALMKKAVTGAEEAVFRGDPGEITKAIAYARRKIPGARFVMPFLNTPANLLKYGIKNSPLGLLDYGAWRKALAGNPEGADELAKAFIGSSVAAAISSGVASGVIDITAAAPVDAGERDRFYREGKLPFAIKLPGAGWVEYKQLPMFDTTLTLVASAVDGIRNGNNVGDIGSQAAANIATNLFDKSYMSGISDLLDAVQDPVRFAERYALRQVTGLIPFSGLQRQTAAAIDQTARAPEGLKETIMAGIPGLSDNVPARRDAFGETIDRGMPTPVRVSGGEQSAVDAELERLGVEVGFAGKSIAGRPLTREQQDIYQKVAGERTRAALETMFNDPRWANLSEGDKEKAVEKRIAQARDTVRDLVDRLVSAPQYKNLEPERQDSLLTELLQKIEAGWSPAR